MERNVWLNSTLFSDADNLTITQDAMKGASGSSKNKRDSEASFYSLYTAGSSLSLDLDIWEQGVGGGGGEIWRPSRGSDASSRGKSSNSKGSGSNNSYGEFCRDTLTWLQEDDFCAPKATVDTFEDDDIVSSFSKFNQLMEKLKETKMSDLSDFDDKATVCTETTNKTKHSSPSDSSSNTSSTNQVYNILYTWYNDVDIEYYFLPGGFKKDAIQDLRTLSIQEQGANTNNYTQMCSSDEDECCVSPLLDSSPEITRAGDREDSDGDDDDHELCDKRQQDTDSDTGLVKFGDLF